MQLAEIFAVLFQCPGFVPSSCNSGIILPGVEQIKMIGVGIIKSDHGKMLFQMRDPSAIDDRSWFRLGLPDGMHRVSWHSRELGSWCILERKGRGKPGDWISCSVEVRCPNGAGTKW